MLSISWATQGRAETETIRSQGSDNDDNPQKVAATEEDPSTAIVPLTEEAVQESVDALQEPVLPDVVEDHGIELDEIEQWAAKHLDFSINVHSSGGGKLATVDVFEGSAASVRALKLAIMLATGILCSQQRLTHQSDLLRDDQATLESLGLKSGMSVTLTENDSYQLSEEDLADLHEAFTKRMEEKCRAAMATECYQDCDVAVSEYVPGVLRQPLECEYKNARTAMQLDLSTNQAELLF